MKTLRLGRFCIHRVTILTDPDVVKMITRDMIIYRAEMLLHKDAIEYMAVSDLFDEVREGIEIPRYILSAERIDDEIKIKCEKNKGSEFIF